MKRFGFFRSKSKRDLSLGFLKHPICVIEAETEEEANFIFAHGRRSDEKPEPGFVEEGPVWRVPDGYWTDCRELDTEKD